jgi:hypothetical protein
VLQERVREPVERVAVLSQQAGHGRVRLVDQSAHLAVGDPQGRRREGTGSRPLLCRRGLVLERDQADGLAHAPARDHVARELGRLPDVLLGARGDVPVEELLGDPAAERDGAASAVAAAEAFPAHPATGSRAIRSVAMVVAARGDRRPRLGLAHALDRPSAHAACHR